MMIEELEADYLLQSVAIDLLLEDRSILPAIQTMFPPVPLLPPPPEDDLFINVKFEESLFNKSQKDDLVDEFLGDPSVVSVLDSIMRHVRIYKDIKSALPVKETRLTPSKLEGIGKEKVRRLDEYGINSVESLACIDETNGMRASQITGNVRQDGAIRTITGWKRKAITYIQRTHPSVEGVPMQDVKRGKLDDGE